MNRDSIISELEAFKEQVIVYQRALTEFQQLNKRLEEIKQYKPRRLAEFDDKYFNEYMESKIGRKRQPKKFAYLDPRRLSKKAVSNRHAEIEKHSRFISKLKDDFDLKYKEKRQELKEADDREKSEKIQLATNKLKISKELLEIELCKIESVNLLPKSMFSSEIIDQIIKYFSDWRVDNVKEAINLYFKETCIQEERQRLKELFDGIEKMFTENNELLTRVLEETISTANNLSELSNTVDDLRIKIDLMLDD